MTTMSRLKFCTLVGAGLSGVVLTGCTSDNTGPTTAGPTAAMSGTGSLEGVSLTVRRDPG